MAEKAWADDHVVAGLVRAFVDVLDPRATLCSFGNGTQLTQHVLQERMNDAADQLSRDPAVGRTQELSAFGFPPRFDVRMFPLLHEIKPSSGVVICASTLQLRRVVEAISRQFCREERYDDPLFSADPDDRSEGVLFDSRRFSATFPIAAGAAGFTRYPETWALEWVWIHPYDRHRGLLRRAWSELESEFGQFRVEGPYTPAMAAFLRAQKIDEYRLSHSISTS